MPMPYPLKDDDDGARQCHIKHSQTHDRANLFGRHSEPGMPMLRNQSLECPWNPANNASVGSGLLATVVMVHSTTCPPTNSVARIKSCQRMKQLMSLDDSATLTIEQTQWYSKQYRSSARRISTDRIMALIKHTVPVTWRRKPRHS